MKISLFRGGWQTEYPSETIESWDELVDIVTTPEEGQKNGDYIVRGFCDGKRQDSSMKTIDLIIIDGDQTLTNGKTCEPLLKSHNAIKHRNITHVIFNSYSNDPWNNINKWRILIPCPDIVDKATLSQGVDEIITILHQDGVNVKNAKENHVISQPWFTPRCRTGLIDDFDFRTHDGAEYRLTGKIIDSARYGNNPEQKEQGGIFSWETVGEMFRSGTLHQGLKMACGWMVFSTDWSDSQIKQFLAQVVVQCPDKEKVDRALKGDEVDKLLQYCRKKQGTDQVAEVNWKDHLIDADKLKDKEFPPIVWAVDGVVPEGLTVLAGDPKAGKSLMAVDMCSSIASGTEAFGGRKCVEGDVVYISLEDPERRVKERIKQQCDLWPNKFHLVTGGIPTVGEEFYQIFDEMLLLWPGTRAIIVDTMQFIIPSKPNGVNDYDHYYKCLDPLHRWSLSNHVAVVLITHKSKSKATHGDNPFAGIIGSVAIQGTSDAMIMLSRNHGKKSEDSADGFLDITGRELSGEKFSLDFDSEALKWAISEVPVATAVSGNTNWLQVEMALNNGPLGPSKIAEEAGMNPSTVKTCLRRMKEAGLVSNEGGKWSLTYGKTETI